MSETVYHLLSCPPSSYYFLRYGTQILFLCTNINFRGRLTYTEKFLGALVIFPVGERVFGMCSNVKAVG